MLSLSTGLPSKILGAIVLSLLIFHTSQHECIHDHLESDIKISDSSYSMYSHMPGRFLKEYQKIDILVDSSTLTGVTSDFKNYIVNSVMPVVKNYFEATLKVPERTNRLNAGGYSMLCSGQVKIPSKYNNNGVDADLVLFLNAVNDPSASYVASASSCLLDPTTRRPIIGRMTYNVARISATTNDAQRERDIVTTLHEMTHALGFSSALYRYYINPETGNDLTGHLSTKTIMGFSTVILNLKPLTTRLQAHFNCSSLPGAYIENQGGPGSAGSHFERRVFYNEYMTASTLIDTRITEFSLALLEGTGWYQINYDMAEPMTWGKNKGCDFVQGACVNKKTRKPNFEEFCSPMLTKGCSWTQRAGSSCGAFRSMVNSSLPSEIDWWGDKTISQDVFSDNCPIQLPYGNLDCEDPDNQGGATLSTEVYGYGSKCFMATLYPRGELSSAYPYCFKSKCKETANKPGNYYLEVKIGSTVVNCTSESKKKVSGYSGTLSCPDPQAFCSQVMSEGFCRRKCSGRGQCVQKECVCQDGWDGFDCSKPTYTDGCSRCATSNPFETSCYGDSCECNPSNTTCMCALGLKTGSACDALQGTISTINSTISFKTTINTETAEGTETTQGQTVVLSQETSSGGFLLPFILGGFVGVIIASGSYFIVQYMRRRKSRATKYLGNNNNPTKRARPPKLQISKDSPRSPTDISNPNSPDLLKRGLSMASHNDSPLIKLSSPIKEIHTPSIFRKYLKNAQPEVPEVQEFGLNIFPVSPENNSPDIEAPKFDEKCVPASLSLPELTPIDPKEERGPNISIQNF